MSKKKILIDMMDRHFLANSEATWKDLNDDDKEKKSSFVILLMQCTKMKTSHPWQHFSF